jgi:hypothetical protein
VVVGVVGDPPPPDPDDPGLVDPVVTAFAGTPLVPAPLAKKTSPYDPPIRP